MSDLRQYSLNFGHTPGLSRDDLVVGPANRAAVEFVESWPEWPSRLVILAGPAGSGKSHLASIWREVASARTLTVPTLVAAERMPGPFLIDDVDAGAIDETGLFHLINGVLQDNSWLLMTARRFPVAWGVTLPDLASRLRAASLVEVGEPDDTLLGGVITKLFADRQVEVDSAVVQFLVRRMERSLPTACAVVARLDQVAMERKMAITRSLAAEMLTEMDAGQGALDL